MKAKLFGNGDGRKTQMSLFMATTTRLKGGSMGESGFHPSHNRCLDRPRFNLVHVSGGPEKTAWTKTEWVTEIAMGSPLSH